MKRAAVYAIILGSVLSGACIAYATSHFEEWSRRPTPTSWATKSPWAFAIFDNKGKVMASMTLRFTDEKAVSCAGGNWRRVAVSGLTAADQKFFPGTEPLSYDVTGSALLIGRNEICDSYLTLKGELTENTASGEYVSESMFSSRKLGRFIGIRVQ